MRGALLLVFLVSLMTASAAPPLTRAHSHNDYEHEHPLFDALSHGFWSVEADIWLTNGQLLVAHDFGKVSPSKTLQSLYLDPLRNFLATNKSVANQAGPLMLLIDVKSDATNTWLALRDVLASYTNLLTRFTDGRIEPGAITVVLSGNRATSLVAADSVRYAAIDGRLPDLETNIPPASLVPLVSDNWTKFFKWRGQGPLPTADQVHLRSVVAKAHQQGRKLRFWATPDSPACWRVLLDAGVDIINTDRLAELETFLRHP